MNIKIVWTSLILLVVACDPNPGVLAPSYAIGSYAGTVIGKGVCALPAAVLTVNISISSAAGDWYLAQPDIHVSFRGGWVNNGGFLGSYGTAGNLQYVSGHYLNIGAALSAEIDSAGCSYTGTLNRA